MEYLCLRNTLWGGTLRNKAARETFRNSWMLKKINVDDLTKVEHEMGGNNFRTMQDFVDGAGIFDSRLVGPQHSNLFTGEKNAFMKKLFKVLSVPTRVMFATDKFFKHIAHDAKRTATYSRFAKIDATKPESFALGQKIDFIKQQLGNIQVGDTRFKTLLNGVFMETQRPDETVDRIQVTSQKGNIEQFLERDADMRNPANLEKLMNFAVTNDAIAFGKHVTFQDDMGKLMEGSVKLRNSTGGIGRLFVPFMATQGNLIQRGLELTPGLGVVTTLAGLTGQAELNNREQAISTAAKQVEGALILLVVWQALEEGLLTGPPPEDKNKRDAFFRSGKIPHGFQVGGEWISYNRLEPFSFPFSLIADLKNQWDGAETDAESLDLFTKGALVIRDHIIDSTYMRSLDDALGGETSFKRFGSWTAGGLVPYGGLWRFMNAQWQATAGLSSLSGDVDIPERRTFLSTFGQNVPAFVLSGLGLEGSQDAKLDVFGKSITRPSNFFQEWLPIKHKSAEVDAMEQELQDIKLYPGLPSRNITIRGETFELSEEDYSELVVNVGFRLKERYKNFMATAGYKILSTDRKAERLEKLHRSISGRERGKLRNKLQREQRIEVN